MKLGIVTIYDLNNYGNRLQNYALHRTLTKLGATVVTIPDRPRKYEVSVRSAVRHRLARPLKPFLPDPNKRRYAAFEAFTRKYVPTVRPILQNGRTSECFDVCVAGSDQIWNPRFGHLSPVDLLEPFPNTVKVAYAASFGADDLTRSEVANAVTPLQQFDALSVRETAGKALLEELTGREDIEVLMDPTLLLTAEEWGEVEKKPRWAPRQFLLCYFLGDIPDFRRQELHRLAEELGCEVVDLADPTSRAYTCGPSEFLWYMSHAELVCTDSFHGCVYAILNEKPFRRYPREGEPFPMDSRIQTLESMLDLHGVPIETCTVYSEFGTVAARLDSERDRSLVFLKNALEMNQDL